MALPPRHRRRSGEVPNGEQSVLMRLRENRGPLFDDVLHRTDVPARTDFGELPNYRMHKHTLYGLQGGICAGCRVLFPSATSPWTTLSRAARAVAATTSTIFNCSAAHADP